MEVHSLRGPKDVWLRNRLWSQTPRSQIPGLPTPYMCPQVNNSSSVNVSFRWRQEYQPQSCITSKYSGSIQKKFLVHKRQAMLAPIVIIIITLTTITATIPLLMWKQVAMRGGEMSGHILQVTSEQWHWVYVDKQSGCSSLIY